MSTSVTFREQVASILEVHVNSAVADICRLIDDNVTVLHLKISQSVTENEALKTELQLLEQQLDTRRGRRKMTRTVGIQCADFRHKTSVIIKEELEEFSLNSIRNVKRDIKEKDKQNLWCVAEDQREGNEVGGSVMTASNLAVESVEKKIPPSEASDGLSAQNCGYDYHLLSVDTAAEPQHLCSEMIQAYDLADDVSEVEPLPLKQHQGDLMLSIPTELDLNHTSLSDEVRWGLSHHDSPLVKEEVETQFVSHHQGSAEHGLIGRGCIETNIDSELSASWRGQGKAQTETVTQTPPSHDVLCSLTQPHCSTNLLPFESPSSAEKPFVCTQCGRSFGRMHVLKRHLVVHTGLRLHACGQCGKRFSQRGGLQRHQRIHTGERPYPCPFCGKRFGQRSHVKFHLSVHTGERPFICACCGRGFTQPHACQRHMGTCRKRTSRASLKC